MRDFWNNIIRYPTFFISSLFGLILIIIAPLKNLFKIPKLRILASIFSVLFIFFICTVIKAMIGL